jgi:hypothetical protein
MKKLCPYSSVEHSGPATAALGQGVWNAAAAETAPVLFADPADGRGPCPESAVQIGRPKIPVVKPTLSGFVQAFAPSLATRFCRHGPVTITGRVAPEGPFNPDHTAEASWTGSAAEEAVKEFVCGGCEQSRLPQELPHADRPERMRWTNFSSYRTVTRSNRYRRVPNVRQRTCADVIGDYIPSPERISPCT